MSRMQRLQINMGGALFLVGVKADIASRWSVGGAENGGVLKDCTLSAGEVGVAGRQRGAREKKVVTFVAIDAESSGHLVVMQTPTQTATSAHARSMRGALYEVATLASVAMDIMYVGFLRYAVEGILQEGRQLLREILDLESRGHVLRYRPLYALAAARVYPARRSSNAASKQRLVSLYQSSACSGVLYVARYLSLIYCLASFNTRATTVSRIAS
jgi:hypothetical protein